MSKRSKLKCSRKSYQLKIIDNNYLLFRIKTRKKENHHCQQQTATKFSFNHFFQNQFYHKIKHAKTKI